MSWGGALGLFQRGHSPLTKCFIWTSPKQTLRWGMDAGDQGCDPRGQGSLWMQVIEAMTPGNGGRRKEDKAAALSSFPLGNCGSHLRTDLLRPGAKSCHRHFPATPTWAGQPLGAIKSWPAAELRMKGSGRGGGLAELQEKPGWWREDSEAEASATGIEREINK